MSINAYANSNDWTLLMETTSSIVNAHNKAKSIGIFYTQAKCDEALEKAISKNLTQLKAHRVDNSVISNFGKTTYICAPNLTEASSKKIKNAAQQKEKSGSTLRNSHTEF